MVNLGPFILEFTCGCTYTIVCWFVYMFVCYLSGVNAIGHIYLKIKT